MAGSWFLLGPILISPRELLDTNVDVWQWELYGPKLARTTALAGLLAERGLKLTDSHVALLDLKHDIETIVENAQAFNISSLLVPSAPVPQCDMLAEGWRELGAHLAALGDKISGHGISLEYHNHDRDL